MKKLKVLFSGSALASGLVLLLFALMSTNRVSVDAAGPGDAIKIATDVYTDMHAETPSPPAELSGLPDVVITDLWWRNDKVWYQIQNIGADFALGGRHCTHLRIEGALQSIDCVDVDLAPGERATRWLSYISIWVRPREAIEVCADYNDDMREQNETNNCRTESWKRDITPPQITSGPVVSETTTSTALIFWQTDEESDSVVRYARNSARYNLEESSTKLVQDHLLTLTGLESASVYHYTVQSTDAASNTVTGEDGFFTTAPASDLEPPVISEITVTRAEGDLESYHIIASAADNTGVGYVAFYLDGELIGKDYVASPDYETVLVPAAMGISRTTFYSAAHEIKAQAFDLGGLSVALPTLFTPTFEPMQVDAEILYPPPNHTIYIDGDVVPAGTMLDIQVLATEYEWTRAPQLRLPVAYPGLVSSIPTFQELAHAVPEVVLLIDGLEVDSSYSTGPSDFTHDFELDLGGLSTGIHTVQITILPSDGSELPIEDEIHVMTGPEITLERDVTRYGNRFLVALTIDNQGASAAELDRIVDNVRGFQPVRYATENRTVTTACSADTKLCDVEIDFFTANEDTLTLGPGESLTVGYDIVPVLYTADLYTYAAIGSEETTVYYETSGGATTLEKAFWLPNPRTSGDDKRPWLFIELEQALAVSDYLIVTNPTRLFDLYDVQEVDDLLSTMARLASLKQGVLGYLTPIDIPGINWEEWMRGDLINLTEPGGDWAMRLHPDFSTVAGGYLLIVGEVEIVPSWLRSIGRVTWGNSPCATWEVDLSDLPYADTDRIGAPELVVGRIIGNDAAALTRPLKVSINVQEGVAGYGFDRSDALWVSGIDADTDIQYVFTDTVNAIGETMDSEFTVDILQWSQVAADQRLPEFRNLALGKDVIGFMGHGGPDAWAPSLHTGDLPGDPFAGPPIPAVDFGDTNPFIFSLACLTGSYEDHVVNAGPLPCIPFGGGDYNIAEGFFDRGVGIFVGSTEVSSIQINSIAGKDFFETWWQADTNIGAALTLLKRDYWGIDRYRDLWVTEYNLYGDPKYGIAPPPGAAYGSMPTTFQAAPSSLDIVVPDYQVTTTPEGWDDVEIPGGDLWLEPGGYRTPYWSVSVDYPKGQRIQDVSLIDRSGLVTATGLTIPTTTNDIACMACSGVSANAVLVTDSDQLRDWFPDPEEPYRWTITENPDGSTTLRVFLYPFYYSPLTTDVEFYKNYSFEIDVITTTVQIARLATDKAAYVQDENMHVDLWLENTGDAQDVIVSAVVEAEGSGEVVDGLLLRELSDLAGQATFALDWDSTGFEAGYYTVEAEIQDAEGQLLDRVTRRFRLGIVAGQVTALTATPEIFDPGDRIDLTLVFSNTGTVPITGTAVIQVQDGGGEIVQAFNHAIGGLDPGQAVSLEEGWDTSGAAEGSYRILGYVLYDAKATQPVVATVRARARIYLPVIMRGTTRSEPGTRGPEW